jgi:protein-tyrosine phosphatase
MKKILCVCLGNICRSPAVEGILKHELGDGFLVESRGTSQYHGGGSADARSVAVCAEHGVDISKHIAQPLTKEDGEFFDIIFAMDKQNYRDILEIVSQEDRNKVYMFDEEKDVADPYYGEENGFEDMFLHLEERAKEWKKKLDI